MKKILLIVEKSQSELHGRVRYNDDLLVDCAENILTLEKKIKKLLHDFHGLEINQIEFEHTYDITALFDKFQYLNITSIAKKAEINPTLLRQYASGVKHPSAIQAKKLEDAIHKIGMELSSVLVYGK